MDWQTWLAGVAAIAAVAAAVVAWRAHRLASGYQDAFWALEPTQPGPEWPEVTDTVLALRNVGRSDARDVVVNVPFDPTEFWVAVRVNTARVASGEAGTLRFRNLRPDNFFIQLVASGVSGRTHIEVRWRSVSGERRRQLVPLPENVDANTWRT